MTALQVVGAAGGRWGHQPVERHGPAGLAAAVEKILETRIIFRAPRWAPPQRRRPADASGARATPRCAGTAGRRSRLGWAGPETGSRASSPTAATTIPSLVTQVAVNNAEATVEPAVAAHQEAEDEAAAKRAAFGDQHDPWPVKLRREPWLRVRHQRAEPLFRSLPQDRRSARGIAGREMQLPPGECG